MTAEFFLPMIQISSHTEIREPFIYYLADNAPNLSEIINNSLANNLSSTDILGIAMLLLLIISIFKIKIINNKYGIFYRDLLVASIFFIILSSKMFPWELLQDSLYQLQFPWRFIVIATLTISFLGGVTLFELVKTENIKKLIIVTFILLLGLHYSTLFNNRNEAVKANYIHDSNYYSMLIQGRYFNGIKDYTPVSAHLFGGDENYDIRKGKIKFGNNNWRWPNKREFTASSITYTIENNDPKIKNVIIPVFNYLGEHVKWNNKEISVKRAYNGTTKVPIKEGINTYTIYYKYTKFAIISKIISLISMFIFLLLFIRNKLKGYKI